MHWMFMPLRRYADFSGRSRRMEFWMWQLGKFILSVLIVTFVSAMIGPAILSKDPANIGGAVAGALFVYLMCFIVGLAIFIPDLAVTVRRLHDTNRSGWWILAPMAPALLIFVSAGVIGGTVALDPKNPATGPIAALGIIGLVGLLAVAGLSLALLIFYFLEGTPGPNKYGPDPKSNTGQVFS